jgi:hypothetical protein
MGYGFFNNSRESIKSIEAVLNLQIPKIAVILAKACLIGRQAGILSIMERFLPTQE